MNDSDSYNEMIPNLHNFLEDDLNNDDVQKFYVYDELQNVDARYEEKEKIDRGGMKQILLIDDKVTSRRIALAQLHDYSDPENVERFLKEARLTASLEHPNIVPIYDIGINENGSPYFTMKLINGQDLKSFLKEQFKAPHQYMTQHLMDIFIKICDAISFAHSHGVIHLDIKPDNIRIGEYGEVVVCDWGLAKIIDTDDPESKISLEAELYNDVTLNGMVKGSPGYMAPEQIEKYLGSKDQQTDIYALGAVLYFLLCGQRPVKGKNIMEILNKTIEGVKAPPSELNPDIPPGLEAVAMKALSLHKEDRYQSVKELQAEVQKWLDGFATTAENASIIKSVWLFIKRHKAMSFTLLIAAISAAVFVTRIVISERKAVQALALYREEKGKTEQLSHEAAPVLTEIAWVAMKNYNFNRALNKIMLATERYPEYAPALFHQARLQFIMQKYQKCLETMKMIEMIPQENQIYKPLAKKLKDLAQKYVDEKRARRTAQKPHGYLPAEDIAAAIHEINNMMVAYYITGFAERQRYSLEEKVIIAESFMRLTNKHVTDWNYQAIVNERGINLDLSATPDLYSLTAFRNLPVYKLNIAHTKIKELNDLIRMPLVELDIRDTILYRTDKLKGIEPLERVIISKKQYPKLNIPGVEIIRR